MTTWITRLDESGTGPRLAVKDCIDVAGTVTTHGCPAVAAAAEPARQDAECVARARAAGARVVGKTNLHELCHGGTGINEHYGTPVNPRDPRRIPGGSSSGSAVAVAVGEADVAFGTDTSGSIRIPAAACGVAGLKTTYGLVPCTGVLPLAPSLDTVGPLARDVQGLLLGMTWLVPGFILEAPAEQVLRVHTGWAVHPDIDAAVDGALRAAGYPVRELQLDDWVTGGHLADRITNTEAARRWRHLLNGPDVVGANIRRLLEEWATVPDSDLHRWRAEAAALRARLMRLLQPGVVLALPTLLDEPPLLADAATASIGELCGTPSAAGLCALSLPVPATGQVASLQLVGPPHGEGLLLATAARIEAAVTGRRPDVRA